MADLISIQLTQNLQKEVNEFMNIENVTTSSEAVQKLIIRGLETWRRKKAFEL